MNKNYVKVSVRQVSNGFLVTGKIDVELFATLKIENPDECGKQDVDPGKEDM